MSNDNQTDEYLDKIYYLSENLSNLLNLDINEKHSLIDVITKLLSYIKRNNLRNESNPRFFNLDPNLLNIFNKPCLIPYNEIQSYLFSGSHLRRTYIYNI